MIIWARAQLGASEVPSERVSYIHSDLTTDYALQFLHTRWGLGGHNGRRNVLRPIPYRVPSRPRAGPSSPRTSPSPSPSALRVDSPWAA